MARRAEGAKSGYHQRVTRCAARGPLQIGIAVVLLWGCAPTEFEFISSSTSSGMGGSGGTGASVPKQSCAGLPDNCGPGANEDCCTSLPVPGGTYLRSYDGIDFHDIGNRATVSNFALDRFEVTVGRFRAFVAANMGTQANPPGAGDGAHPLIDGSGWDGAWKDSLQADTTALTTALKCDSTYQTWRDTADTADANETLPINCVNWFEAFAFCAWDGGRLPTEAEWNYAAAGGGIQQRYYPWSAAYPPGSTTINSTYAAYDCTGDESAAGDCAFTDIQRVGSRSADGDGRWGQADLGGSMWEWNLDWHSSSYPKPCDDDCANLTAATCRVVRGGTWISSAYSLRAGFRNYDDPSDHSHYIGLRCARTP